MGDTCKYLHRSKSILLFILVSERLRKDNFCCQMSTTKKCYTFYDVTLPLLKILGKRALRQQAGAVLWLRMCQRAVGTGGCSAGAQHARGQHAEPAVRALHAASDPCIESALPQSCLLSNTEVGSHGEVAKAASGATEGQ